MSFCYNLESLFCSCLAARENSQFCSIRGNSAQYDALCKDLFIGNGVWKPIFTPWSESVGNRPMLVTGGSMRGFQHCSALPERPKPVITGEGVHYFTKFGTSNRSILQETDPGIGLYDITPEVHKIIADCGLKEGFVNIVSGHTTTAVTVNEYEPRLLEDIKIFLRKFAPAGDNYLHDDLHVRESPDGWPGGWKAWVDQEPKNAQAHIQSIFLGNTESIPVVGGELHIGRWQSIIFVELDGARSRSIRIQAIGEMS